MSVVFPLISINDQCLSPLQRENLLRNFETYVCNVFNMGRKSEGHTNFVVDDMSASLDCLNHAYEIECEIEATETRLKGLREERVKNKKQMSKIYNRSKRNFPKRMFGTYVDVIEAAQMMLDGIAKSNVEENEHPVTMIGNAEEKESSKLTTKRRRCPTKRSLGLKSIWNLGLRKVKEKNDLTERGKASVSGKAVPIWDKNKPGEIKISSDGAMSERVFEVYQPSYTPNPFEDFMMKM